MIDFHEVEITHSIQDRNFDSDQILDLSYVNTSTKCVLCNLFVKKKQLLWYNSLNGCWLAIFLLGGEAFGIKVKGRFGGASPAMTVWSLG